MANQRAKYKRMLSTWLPKEIYTAITERARAKGIPKSKAAEEILIQGLNKYDRIRKEKGQ